MIQSAVKVVGGPVGSRETGIPRGPVVSSEEEGGGGETSAAEDWEATATPGVGSRTRGWRGRPRIWPPPHTAQTLRWFLLGTAQGRRRKERTEKIHQRGLLRHHSARRGTGKARIDPWNG